MGYPFTVTVNYDLTTEDMIKSGKYDWISKSITSINFPPRQRSGLANTTIEIIHFNRRHTSSYKDLEELDKMGLRPANLHELISLGKEYPNLQHVFPIAALGSIRKSYLNGFGVDEAPYLFTSDSGRCLGLFYCDSLVENFRLAAVRK